jgi:hypothetical protein
MLKLLQHFESSSRLTVFYSRLRRCPKDAEIDDVVVVGGERTIRESFRNTEQGWSLYALHLAGLVLLFAAVVGVGQIRASPRGWKRPLLQFSLMTFLAILVGLLYLAFDYAYWSRLPLSVLTRPLPSQRQSPEKVLFENYRFSLFGWWYQSVGGLQITRAAVVDAGYPRDRIRAGPVMCGVSAEPCRLVTTEDISSLTEESRPDRRVLFAGTSQTIGAGANKLDDTFFVQTHRQLAASLSPLRLKSINISMSAVSPPFLLHEYEEKYLRLQPDLMVINLGTNGINEELIAGLSRFVEINRSHHIPTVIILEPNSNEVDTTIKEKHHIIRSISRK